MEQQPLSPIVDPLWPLSSWDYPLFWGALVFLGLASVLVGWWLVRRKRRVMHRLEMLGEQLQLLKKLDLEVDYNRKYISALLLRLMQDVAFHEFGLNVEHMTDEEFVAAVEKSELPESFVQHTLDLAGEVVGVKFAAAVVPTDKIMDRINAIDHYFADLLRSKSGLKK